jgi:hypothetical protein
MNYEIIEREDANGNIQNHVIINNGDGSFTSMLKSTWDELQAQQAEHLNGSVDA